MVKVFLQKIIDDLRFDNLPPNWNSFDLNSFSKSKNLWDYQQDAVENAIKVLWKYFEDFVDYQENGRLELNLERKQKFFEWYKDNGLEEDLDIRLKNNTIKNRSLIRLLNEYYDSQVEPLRRYKRSIFDYENFINRMCFWMATGSGKTLVLIKIIQNLKKLMERGEVPPYDILILTYRDDLIDQLKEHVGEFNYANSECFIRLRGLKEYETVKRENPTLFKDNEVTVFYYRSDNLSDVQKEKIIDFRNYDNDGKWYVFLDEAHKGGREDSKRQQIYSILSRNGFLFNFSATFTDTRDVITCAYEFNLSTFIDKGYGKHIGILKQEIRAFGDDEDYNDEEKQKIVLKSLILLTYVKKFYQDIQNQQSDLYHSPLLLTLVNSVNTEDVDLKLFFRELEKVGKDELKQGIFRAALDELWEELKQEPEFMFEEGEKIRIDKEIFMGITTGDILRYVFNSDSSGEIEVLRRQSNRKELAFKLKVSDKPFALIKIGDISTWLKEELVGYEVQERFEDEGYFENLNREESEINILMGSRSFYEGWDSNRPNLINYINIGMGTDAKKFILQSVGRGVRIEPVKDKRRRLLFLHDVSGIDEKIFCKIKEQVLPLETLFIFGTNREALKTVIEELHREGKKEERTQLSLFENREAREHKLLVPTYKPAAQPTLRNEKRAKFPITDADFELVSKFTDFIPDDRVLMMKFNAEPEKIRRFRESADRQSEYYRSDNRSYKNVNLLVKRIFDWFSVIPEEIEGLKELQEEIRHFRNIEVFLEDISGLKKRIEKVKDYKDRNILEEELDKKFEREKITKEQYKDGIKKMTLMSGEERIGYGDNGLKIKCVANHYYFPLILSEDETADYISHIVKVPSEVDFLNELDSYLKKDDNRFKEFDWWYFSKLDESLDEVYIPYYDGNANQYRKFFPDFIFWLKKEDDYFIVFVDPKGTEYADAERRIDGYRQLFEEDGEKKVIEHDGFNVKITLLLKTDDVAKATDQYRKYWFDDIEKMFERLTL